MFALFFLFSLFLLSPVLVVMPASLQMEERRTIRKERTRWISIANWQPIWIRWKKNILKRLRIHIWDRDCLQYKRQLLWYFIFRVFILSFSAILLNRSYRCNSTAVWLGDVRYNVCFASSSGKHNLAMQAMLWYAYYCLLALFHSLHTYYFSVPSVRKRFGSFENCLFATNVFAG